MKKLTLSIAVFVGLALSAFGQTALVQTTLSAAMTTSSTTTAVVASATGITAGRTMLYVIDGGGPGEAMFVNAVNSTTLTVQRGASGTSAAPHISGALAFVGTPGQFYQTEPFGACTAANTPVTPYINIKTGNQWLCSTVTLSWVPGFFNDAAPAAVTAVVASVAGATLPSGPLFHVSGTNAITAWGSTTAIPAVGAGGSATSVVGAPFCVIPDAAFTWTATNNIATAGTAVANLEVCFTFDSTNKKYVQLQSK